MRAHTKGVAEFLHTHTKRVAKLQQPLSWEEKFAKVQMQCQHFRSKMSLKFSRNIYLAALRNFGFFMTFISPK